MSRLLENNRLSENMASVQFSIDTIKRLQSFVEDNKDVIKNENEYIEYCNLLMAAYKNPPNNPGQSNPANGSYNIPYQREFISPGRLVNESITNYWNIKIFEKVLNRVYNDSTTQSRIHQTRVLSNDFITVKKHRFNKTVLLEKAKVMCDQRNLNFNKLKKMNKDQIVLFLERTVVNDIFNSGIGAV